MSWERRWRSLINSWNCRSPLAERPPKERTASASLTTSHRGMPSWLEASVSRSMVVLPMPRLGVFSTRSRLTVSAGFTNNFR